MPTPKQFFGTYLSRYNSGSLDYQCHHTNTICDLSTPLPLGAISFSIDINRKLPTIDPKLKGDDPQPV